MRNYKIIRFFYVCLICVMYIKFNQFCLYYNILNLTLRLQSYFIPPFVCNLSYFVQSKFFIVVGLKKI